MGRPVVLSALWIVHVLVAKSVPPLALCALPWEAIDGITSTVPMSELGHVHVYFQWRTWKALRMRKTRSYASFGGRRLMAKRTTSDSSGIRSSALEKSALSYISCTSGHGFAIGDSSHPYLKPSDLYPAALLYQLEIGVNQVLSHGRLMIKLTRDGCDIVVRRVCAGGDWDQLWCRRRVGSLFLNLGGLC